MRLELTEGCICGSFYAGGRPVHELSGEELKDLLRSMTDKVFASDLDDGKSGCIQEVLRMFTECFCDTYECSDEPCEACGDYMETYTINV